MWGFFVVFFTQMHVHAHTHTNTHSWWVYAPNINFCHKNLWKKSVFTEYISTPIQKSQLKVCLVSIQNTKYKIFFFLKEWKQLAMHSLHHQCCDLNKASDTVEYISGFTSSLR